MPEVHTQTISVDVSILTKSGNVVKADFVSDEIVAEAEALLTALLEEKMPGAVVEISKSS